MKNPLLITILFLLVVAAAGCERKLPVKEGDKTMIVRAGDLAPYGYSLEGIERYESFTKTRLFDGSFEIEYQFETPDSERDNPLYLYVSVTVERKKSDVLISQGAGKIGVMYGLRSVGIKERLVNDFYTYGESSSFYMLEKEGRPVGNLFMVRDGLKIYTLILSGLYFDDKEVWKELVDAKLRKFSTYKPD